MSKNDMVMVSRTSLEDVLSIDVARTAAALECFRAALAQQHQGEPVVMLRGSRRVCHCCVGMDREEWCSVCDSAAGTEVERLRERMLACEEIAENNAKAFAEASIKLAEAQALLREVVDAFKLEPDGSCINPGREFIRPWSAKLAALSASAEPIQQLVECDACPRSSGCVGTCMKTPASAEPSAPACLTCKGSGLEYDSGAAHPCTDCKSSAPVEIDERADFEVFHRKHLEDAGMDPQDIASEFDRNDNGDYVYCMAADAWPYWQARAALARKP